MTVSDVQVWLIKGKEVAIFEAESMQQATTKATTNKHDRETAYVMHPHKDLYKAAG